MRKPIRMLGFFLEFWNLLRESLNKLFVFMAPDLYLSIEIIDDENSRKTTDSMKIQFLI
jgi:hypothetical protein